MFFLLKKGQHLVDSWEFINRVGCNNKKRLLQGNKKYFEGSFFG